MPIPRSLLSREPMVDLDLELVAGALPAGLGGEVFISCSDQATAERHAFFGDGLMVRLSLEPGTHGAPAGRHAWRPRLLETPSRLLRAARPELFEAQAFGTMSPFGFSNCANTAPLPWGNRLFATWDAGRPVEVDPVTLDVLGEVGDRASWGDDAFGFPVLPMYPSTAHPVIDPERRCMWTVKTDPMTQALDVVRYDGSGRTVQRWPLDGATLPQSLHTVGQTRDWLVLVDCAFRIDPGELSGRERTVTTFTDEPVFLVRKDALEATPHGQPVPVTTLRVGPETNHYYAVWDDRDGIRLLLEHTIDTDLAMCLRDGDVDAWGRPVDPRLHGLYNHPMHHGVLSEVRIDPDAGTIELEARYEDPDLAWATQLSAMDWSTEGITTPEAHHKLFTGYRPDGINQRAIDLYQGRVDPSRLPREEVPPVLLTLARGGLEPKATWTFGTDDYATSPCFVPRTGPVADRPTYDPADPARPSYVAGRPGGFDGWVVVPVLNDDRFRVEIFDASGVGDGPVATLATPAGTTVPFLIHSAWMPVARPGPDVERLRFADDIDPDALASLPDDLASVVTEVAARLG